MLERFTDDEKLSVVERILDDLRTQSGWFPMPGDREILKAIAVDLRAKTPLARSKALDAIGFQVQSAIKAKVQLGYIDINHQQAVCDRVLAHWPTVERALRD